MAVEIDPVVLLIAFAAALLAPTLTVYLLLAYRMEHGFEQVHEEIREHAAGERERIEAAVSAYLEEGRTGPEPTGTDVDLPASTTPRPQAPGPGPSEGGPRYLVVDDVPTVRRTIEAYLEQQGVDPEAILTAGDAADALQLFREHRPPIVVLDIELPDLDGHDIARQIRALEPDTHIVVVTSLGEDDPRVETVAEIAADQVEKPIEPADLGALDREAFPPDAVDEGSGSSRDTNPR